MTKCTEAGDHLGEAVSAGQSDQQAFTSNLKSSSLYLTTKVKYQIILIMNYICQKLSSGVNRDS